MKTPKAVLYYFYMLKALERSEWEMLLKRVKMLQ